MMASGRKEGGEPGLAAAAAAAAATSGGNRSSSRSKYAATCHRLVVLECQPFKPRALLVSCRVSYMKYIMLYIFIGRLVVLAVLVRLNVLRAVDK